ncbi:GIY-YIG nuclease family protein [Patescibacteria group bacterium]|nr:GIY-YIG nuclease family protein [Patescibacteria group bacterium]MBU0776849.1 GIY-YIG nuclease family protein [Patescibacteria group bacterium]MBU0846223.1 GIY-YIG nuclease family protein [Patescibacteria group bacterium]MBU0922619.1 GIY-YIG nuclease family protein [Patescibacteria group bacterium]MBU1066670.1 GIY-YIG nuclease family protein [Patescibacteria group bacterium]
MFYTYIIRTTGNTLYTGQTNNLKRRVEEHTIHGKRASKYLKSFLGCKLVYYEIYPIRSEAMRREAELKNWSHDEKEDLVKQCQFPLTEFNVEQKVPI